MRKSLSIVCMSLLTVSLMIPIGHAYAGGNPPGNHRQREELRRDQRELQELRQRRNRELREGDALEPESDDQRRPVEHRDVDVREGGEREPVEDDPLDTPLTPGGLHDAAPPSRHKPCPTRPPAIARQPSFDPSAQVMQ